MVTVPAGATTGPARPPASMATGPGLRRAGSGIGLAEVASWSLRRKLVVASVSCVVVPAVVGCALFLFTLTRITETDLELMVTNATATATAIQADIDTRVVGYASMLARQPEVTIAASAGNPAVLEEMLVAESRALRELDPSVSTVAVIGRDGVVLARSSGSAAGHADRSGDALVQSALRGTPAHGLSITSGEELAYEATAPLTFGPQILGVLSVRSSLEATTAGYIKEKTGAEIVFIVGDRIQATTLDGVEPDHLAGLDSSGPGSATDFASTTIGGSSYIVGYAPLQGEGQKVQAAMAVLVSRERVERAKAAFMWGFLVFIVATVGLMAWGAGALSRRLANPLQMLISLADKIAEGDLREREVPVTRQDEIGRSVTGMVHAVDRVRQALQSIAASARQLSVSAAQLSTISQDLLGNADTTSSQATMASAAADEVSQNVSTAAAAAEEMSASIADIARSIHSSAEVAAHGVELARRANSTVNQLGETSSTIGRVVQIITAIAEQTNLLALNATIEASRAGEAGKGFAVVATEVKELAKQTGSATGEIAAEVAAIQRGTREAVAAIAEIGGLVDQISDVLAAVAAAIEEQTATAAEIGRSVSEAASGSSTIAENVEQVAAVAEKANAGAVSTLEAARGLDRMAQELADLVGQFRY